MVNDFALDQVYDTADQLVSSLEPLLKLRNSQSSFRHGLLCCRSFGDLSLSSGEKFSRAIGQYHDRNKKALILNWISKSGPFWDDSREHIVDDYFEFYGNDVTDCGLGECARLRLNDKPVESLSVFEKINVKFNITPLLIQHGLPEDILGQLSVDNVWEYEQLNNSIDNAIPRPENWSEAVEYLTDRFKKLQFSDQIIKQLSSQPFNYYVVERLIELLGVLQLYIESRDDDGEYTEQTKELLANHFNGSKAWFTDESISNIRDFKQQLTFNDSDGSSNKIFAPFHGKIKTPQFRVHFPWPIKAEDIYIKILYIGPKITKA